MMINVTVNLRNVCYELGPVKHNWLKIGVQLGVPWYELRQCHDSNDPLSAEINYWLHGNTKVPISWISIVEALESDYVSEKGLAKKLRSKLAMTSAPQSTHAGTR